MNLAIRIIDQGSVVGFFENDFSNLVFQEHLLGVGTGSFRIPTQSDMFELLKPGNIIQVIDISQNDEIVFTGFIRPFVIGFDTTIIQFNESKDRLNYDFAITEGTVTSISQALTLSQFPGDLKCGDRTFSGIKYNYNTSVYSLFEEIQKVTGLWWTFDGETIVWNCEGELKNIEITNSSDPGSCGENLVAYNVTGTYAQKYDRIVGYAKDVGVYFEGPVGVEGTFEFQVDNMADLVSGVQNKLAESQDRAILTFDISGQQRLLPGDRVYIDITGGPDILNQSGIVNILKVEGRLEGCELLYKVWVSDIITSVTDNYNVSFNLSQRISKLQSRG